MSEPIENPLQEAARVIEAANAGGPLLRLTGGVAIASISPSALRPPLQREYGDIDFVARRHDVREIEAFFEALGWRSARTRSRPRTCCCRSCRSSTPPRRTTSTRSPCSATTSWSRRMGP
jgi:hypothetical protein